MRFSPSYHVVLMRFLYQQHQLEFECMKSALKAQGRNMATDPEFLKRKHQMDFFAAHIFYLEGKGDDDYVVRTHKTCSEMQVAESVKQTRLLRGMQRALHQDTSGKVIAMVV